MTVRVYSLEGCIEQTTLLLIAYHAKGPSSWVVGHPPTHLQLPSSPGRDLKVNRTGV
jgi:hypothetical protein